jgi:hypothetical protein
MLARRRAGRRAAWLRPGARGRAKCASKECAFGRERPLDRVTRVESAAWRALKAAAGAARDRRGARPVGTGARHRSSCRVASTPPPRPLTRAAHLPSCARAPLGRHALAPAAPSCPTRPARPHFPNPLAGQPHRVRPGLTPVEPPPKGRGGASAKAYGYNALARRPPPEWGAGRSAQGRRRPSARPRGLYPLCRGMARRRGGRAGGRVEGGGRGRRGPRARDNQGRWLQGSPGAAASPPPS